MVQCLTAETKEKNSQVDHTMEETQKATVSNRRTVPSRRSSPSPKKYTYLIHHQEVSRKLNDYIMANVLVWYPLATQLKKEEDEVIAFLRRIYIVMSMRLLPYIIENFKERWGSKHVGKMEEHDGDCGFYVTRDYEIKATVIRIPVGATKNCRHYEKAQKKAQIDAFLHSIDGRMAGVNAEISGMLSGCMQGNGERGEAQ